MKPHGAVIFLEGREPRHAVRRQRPRKINGDRETKRSQHLITNPINMTTPGGRKTQPKEGPKEPPLSNEKIQTAIALTMHHAYHGYKRQNRKRVEMMRSIPLKK